jgi:hypothetical protein
MAGANTRLAELEQAETRVLDRLAGVGQLLADTMATLREGQREAAVPFTDCDIPEVPEMADTTDDGDDRADQPSAKVYFVEFPPLAPAAPMPQPADSYRDPEPESEIVLTETPGASLFNSDRERSEWAPPPDMPTWWTRDGAQG